MDHPPDNVDLNLQGARIAHESSNFRELRQIALPHQHTPVKHFSMDIGGSLAKIVYFEPTQQDGEENEGQGSIGGKLNFIKFQTSNMKDCMDFILEKQLHIQGQGRKSINITGGGAYKYADYITSTLGVRIHKVDEMHALITGLNFLLKNVPKESFTYSTVHNDPDPKHYVPVGDNPFPYLLVNIGSGVSILKVESEDSYQRIDGTSLGGGTFYGLCNLLTGLTNFDEILELSTKGDSNNVDLVVGDIYGSDYSKVGLAADVIASSFGKLLYKDKMNISPSKADICMSLLKMMCNNIGQIAYLDAIRHNLTRIYFGGFFIRDHPDTMHRISYAVDFWSKSKVQAMFLLHEGYLGALGAFLHFSPQAKPTSPRPTPSQQVPLEKPATTSWFQRILQSYAPLSFDFNLRTQPQKL
eukprot:Phypoly_transcript_05389.p1 GENE.Phypoly_transcript_05389~~Phypoly_transcript_05389.p1  ORF type:complete len:413 (+),score=47.21 Phypoly_transcript_05389:339-1577(+)